MNFSYYIKKLIGIQRKNLSVIKNFGKLKCGMKVSFGKKVDVLAKKGGKIKIGDGSSVAQYSYIATVGGNIYIGKNVSFNRNVTIACHEKINIEDYCSVGPGVTIYDHDHKFSEFGKEKGFNTGEIYIGKNCWIGANVTILRGTYIGDNCVIGAGCVIKGEIPEGMLVTQGRESTFTKLRKKSNE